MSEQRKMIPAILVETLVFHRDGGSLSESGWVRVCVTHDSDSRWQTHHTLVLRDPEGRYWGVLFSRGKTEEQGFTFPWRGGEDVVDAFRLYPHRVARVEYRTAPLTPSAAPLNLSGLQDWPERVEDVNAPRLLRAVLVSARVCEAKVADAAATPGQSLATLASEYGATWGMVALLRRLIAVAPGEADVTARQMYESWEDGANMGELLYEWLGEAGLDPEAIQAAYERAKGERA